MSTQELIDAVRQWGIDKGITGPSGKATIIGQLNKSQEELTETRDSALLGNREQFVDGIGDTAITLILAAEVAGIRFEDCLLAAYGEIKGRTGRVENGVFIKD